MRESVPRLIPLVRFEFSHLWADVYGGVGKENRARCGFESHLQPKKIKKVLTNRKVCAIIKTQRQEVISECGPEIAERRQGWEQRCRPIADYQPLKFARVAQLVEQ